jgi:acetate kinase
MTVLALNAGSSSLKFGVFEVDGNSCRRLLSGEAETGGVLIAQDSRGNRLTGETSITDAHAALAAIARLLEQHDIATPAAVGHRIVHGGPHCRDHALIDEVVMEQLRAAARLAPLHVPAALELLDAARDQFPQLSQVACLDTAFHRTLPDIARTLPLPKSLREQGVQRYGFHGLSCESIVRQLGDALPSRLVVAHLGHGASVTAVANGRSIDTSMGMTPSGGVVMSTRTGDIDPGVLIYAARHCGLQPDALEDLVDRRSGMLGVSGLSGDLRVLRAAAADSDAQLAIDLFCYSVRKQIGAMAAALGGIDLLVFTGGIGEHDERARAAICTGLDYFGQGRALPVRVLPSQEDEQIARHTWQLVSANHTAARAHDHVQST